MDVTTSHPTGGPASVAGPELTLSAIPAPLTDPVLRGEVAVPGVRLTLVPARTVDGNSRQMLNLAFDVAEMSFATFLRAREDGVPLLGLPIFTGRRFLQPGVAVRADAGIRTPDELAGKRVGLPQFWMTSSVWQRGILHSEHGVAQDQVAWYTSRPERASSMVNPPGVDVHAQPEGTDPLARVAAGDLDAALLSRVSDAALQGDSRLARPFPDLREAQRAYYRQTGVFPVMHFVVMKEAVHREHPWLAEALCAAFQQAKNRLGSTPAPIDGDSPAQTRELFGADPWAYGLAPNRRPLETFLRYAREQGLVQRGVALDELFVPSVRDWAG